MSDHMGSGPPSPGAWSLFADMVAWFATVKGSILPGVAGALVRGMVTTGLTLLQRIVCVVSGVLAYLWLGPVTGPIGGHIAQNWIPINLPAEAVDGGTQFLTGLCALTIVEAALKAAAKAKDTPGDWFRRKA